MLTKIKVSYLIVGVFVFTSVFSLPVPFNPFGSVSLAQEKEATVDGFRSATFGMTQREVLKVIEKDFDIPKHRITSQDHPIEKTRSLGIEVNDLLPGSGPSRVFYILGYRSKKLIQVNILWGKPAAENFDPDKVVDTANQLRNHFVQKNFPREGLVVNQPLNKEGTAILVFRGKDNKGRMALLILENPKVEGQKENANISLKLSYMEKPDSPDVFKINQDDF